MAGFDVSRIIAAHQAGIQVKQSREQQQRVQDEHDLKVKEAKLNLDTLKLQQAKMQHEAGMADVSAASGQQSVFPGFQASATPGGEVQDGATPAPYEQPPVPMAGIPQNIADLLNQHRQAPLYSAPIGGVDSTQTVMPEAISVPSAMPGGAPISITPQTLEQQLAAKNKELAIQRSMQPPVFGPAGSQPFVPLPTGGYAPSGAPVPKEQTLPAIIEQARALTPNFDTLSDPEKLKAVASVARAIAAPQPEQSPDIQALNEYLKTPGNTALGYEAMKAGRAAAASAAAAAGSAPTVEDITKTTLSGTPYADVNQYTGSVKNKILTEAKRAKLPTPTAIEVKQLETMDAARMDAKAMLQQLDSKLGKDATGRVISGAENVIGKFAQTDPILGAVGTFQSAAIRQILALGATGRVNQHLIDVAIKNDVPQITDTIGTAQQRVKNLTMFFDDAEKAILGGGNSGPKKGDVQDGYVFQGGNPADQKNWKKK